ncbi:GspH/FimT family pseudopilin [bacterium]|nr:GspH/FimT family pseudopilin [bacterium]
MLRRRTLNSQCPTLNFFGFTLLELLVVLAIMAMLTGMSVPAISGYIKGARLKGGAREIASALRLARTMAITKRDIYSVDFDIANRQFWIEWSGNVVGETYTLPDTIDIRRPGAIYNEDDYITFVNNQADFKATGGLSGTSGSVWVADKNDNYKRIGVSNTTGRVIVDEEINP